MKKQWMLAFAMVAGLAACSKSKNEKKMMYGYTVSESANGVEKCRAEHWFASEAERCAALPNDSFNKYCNPEGRASLFESSNCDKSLAVNSSIRQYFAENGGGTRGLSLRPRDSLNRSDSLELDMDADGCFKGRYKWMTQDNEKCRGRY